MKQAQETITVSTRGQGLYEVTKALAGWVESQDIDAGLLTVFCRHTSASLTIQENADPDVLRDLEHFFANIAPEDPSLYRHRSEGPDDMPAHIKSALTSVQLSVPVSGGALGLGTWQGIYLFEHRRADHQRRLILHLAGV